VFTARYGLISYIKQITFRSEKVIFFNSRSYFLASFTRKTSGYCQGTFRNLKVSVSRNVYSVCYSTLSLSLPLYFCLPLSLINLRISNRHTNGTMQTYLKKNVYVCVPETFLRFLLRYWAS